MDFQWQPELRFSCKLQLVFQGLWSCLHLVTPQDHPVLELHVAPETTTWPPDDKVASWCKELTYWKRPRCWEILRARGEGGDRG